MNGELEEYIGSARWFGGKGRPFSCGEVHRLPWLEAGESGIRVRIELVTVDYDDGASELYQVPMVYYDEPQERLAHARIGEWDDAELGRVHVYDAMHDRNATALWLQAFARANGGPHRTGDLVFHRLPGHELDTEAQSALFSGEQSNSSLAFGEDALMKVFRKVTPGRNPDIEIHEALTRAGIEHVAQLFGWLELLPRDGATEPLQLAMLQQFLRTASDGWELALASVRDLFAEADLHAYEVGGDFASESFRLGAATAHVHTALAEHFPTETWGEEQLNGLTEAMRARLDDAIAVVPDLQQHAVALRSAFDALTTIDHPVVVQRVHADLHLGQTLRTVKGWKIVDFEGEPAKPLPERIRPDSPWRDVAGMMRSFDYAAHAVEVDLDADQEAHAQIAYRAGEWAERNRTEYLAGYVEALDRPADQGLAHDEQALLRAYEIDKAVYETVYEARNRPSWLDIPLAAVGRLAHSVVHQDQEATTHE